MPTVPEKGERIAKVIAGAGLCSRRDAERWIEAGRVKLNGKLLSTPACVISEQDRVEVDGKPLIRDKETPRLWLYHKPVGVVTTHKDPENRPTVFSVLPKDLPRVISIGRLDINSEGLLLLTTSGELSRHLEHPSTGWVRRYRVRVFGKPTDKDLEKLRRGITIEGVRYRPASVEKDRETTSNSWLILGLKEGKNREIRKLFDHLGYPVTRLIRIAYGPFQLGNLPTGDVKEISAKILKQQLGKWMET